MMIDFTSLGINPILTVIIALWLMSYVAAIVWLLRYARTSPYKPIWFWLIVVLFIPAGQFFAFVYLFREQRRA